MSDGRIVLRPPRRGDAEALIAGRDEVFHRWLGPGSENPEPTACIEVAGEVVGWVDYDCEREWLHPGEVNVGYNVFAPYRGNGYASRAVQLLMHHLAVRTDNHTATLVIDAENERSLALATRLQFTLTRIEQRQHHLARPVPPLAYGDGIVTIRPPLLEDLDADLEAKDDQQIGWMWLPGERETWAAMTSGQQRDPRGESCSDAEMPSAPVRNGPSPSMPLMPPTSPTSTATWGTRTSQAGRPTSPTRHTPAIDARATSGGPCG